MWAIDVCEGTYIHVKKGPTTLYGHAVGEDRVPSGRGGCPSYLTLWRVKNRGCSANIDFTIPDTTSIPAIKQSPVREQHSKHTALTTPD